MNLRSHPVLDRLHFRFSHHIEHHFVPKMAHNMAPRVYKSPTELVDPNDEGRVFDLLPLQSEYSTANLN